MTDKKDLGAMIKNTDWPKTEPSKPPDLTVGNIVANLVDRNGDAQDKAFIQIVVDIGVDKTALGVVSTVRDTVVLTGQVFDLGGRISDAMTSGDIKDWKRVGSGALAAGDTALGLVPVVGDMWQLSKWMVEPPPEVIGK
jgi:hypothetical protein